MDHEGRRHTGAAGAPRTRLRWAAVAGVAVLLAATAAVAAGFVDLRLVGPVEAGGGSMTARAAAGVDYRHVQAVDLDARDAYAVDGIDAGTFRTTFEIENRGRVAVTFDDVEEDFEHAPVQRKVLISDTSVLEDPRQGADVELGGVTLDPGERRRLALTYRWKTTCDPGEPSPGGSGMLQHAGVELRYHAFGFLRRSQTLESSQAVVFVCGKLPRPDGEWVTAGQAHLRGR